MKAVGIIAEYNPLHDGHIYHLKEAVRLAGSDAVVVAMSGDYVQRGEPAILDKWERTQMALNNGADVVVEIPTLFCLGNAGQYANAAVQILESFNAVSHIAFGSESGDCNMLSRIAVNLDTQSDLIAAAVMEYVKSGYSYPRSRAAAYRELFPDDSDGYSILANPNDILAIEYIRACKRLKPVAVKRVGADYSESVKDNYEYQSAGGIRKALQSNEDIRNFVPPDVAAIILSAKLDGTLNTPDRWLKTLKFAIMRTSADEIDNCPSGGEGLGNRIKSMVNSTATWDEMIESVKSKRYTYTRISRLFSQIILGISRDDYSSKEPQYVRILGFSEKGRQLISEMNPNGKIPFITNVNRQGDMLCPEGLKQLALDIHAADIYNLISSRDLYELSDYRHKPIIMTK